MNPLPRFVAIVLFLVLAALVALLAVPAWRGLTATDATRTGITETSNASTSRTPTARPEHALFFSQRAALVLAITALALSLALILSHAVRAYRADSRAPFRA